MIEFYVNKLPVSFEGPEDTPLLWVLRDHLKLKGSKFGCGIGSCGACTVHLDGRAKKSCTTRVSTVAGKQVTTIEGLASTDGTLHPVQQAWIDEDVSQCGYCQAGQIMSAVDLLANNSSPDDDDIAKKMNNLCRCGTYIRIRKAVHRASELMTEAD
ncbi:MAG: 2Fe-2S iron-sulfur cluster binding domain-containing protein [Gammaproteobacteria bacterium]|jgi:isoquinoline 1-oxidoreductase alpha subunit|nr:2Fe-2S iron-sulfur cluster binding domain-containing protein [Gammaproteobacteria bacterium]